MKRGWRNAALAVLVAGITATGAQHFAEARVYDPASYGEGSYYSSENPVPLAKPIWSAEIGQRGKNNGCFRHYYAATARNLFPSAAGAV